MLLSNNKPMPGPLQVPLLTTVVISHRQTPIHLQQHPVAPQTTNRMLIETKQQHTSTIEYEDSAFIKSDRYALPRFANISGFPINPEIFTIPSKDLPTPNSVTTYYLEFAIN